MILGDYGTTWTKLCDVDTGERSIVPSREVRKMRADIATGHNASLYSNYPVSELTALVRGGLKLIGDSFHLLDIGGRDMKFVQVEGGKVGRMEWNTQCGAMTGFTLELVGKYFGLDFSQASPVERGYPMTCGVLGLERAFDDLARGCTPEEALARVAKGIAVSAHKFAGSPSEFYLSGGMCDNPLFMASFPDDVQVTPLGRFVLVEGLLAEAREAGLIKEGEREEAR